MIPAKILSEYNEWTHHILSPWKKGLPITPHDGHFFKVAASLNSCQDNHLNGWMPHYIFTLANEFRLEYNAWIRGGKVGDKPQLPAEKLEQGELAPAYVRLATPECSGFISRRVNIPDWAKSYNTIIDAIHRLYELFQEPKINNPAIVNKQTEIEQSIGQFQKIYAGNAGLFEECVTKLGDFLFEYIGWVDEKCTVWIASKSAGSAPPTAPETLTYKILGIETYPRLEVIGMTTPTENSKAAATNPATVLAAELEV